MRHRETKVKVRGLVALGVVALLVAGLLGYVTLRDSGGTSDQAAAAVDTRAFVSQAGGFSLRVPADLKVAQSGSTARFTSADKDLVVSAGPIASGPLQSATVTFLDTVRQGYPDVKWLGSHKERVDGRPALDTYGQVRNAKGVPLRFVVVTIAARPRNFAVTAFTAHDSDPAVVLPRVDAIVNSFHVDAGS